MTKFPDDIQFQPLLLKGTPYFDPPGDQTPTSTDIVGDEKFPAAYYAYDGSNVFFRMRLLEDPRFKTGFQSFSWGYLFDTNNDPNSYEWLLTLAGVNSKLLIIKNATQKINTWADPAESTPGQGIPNYIQQVVNYDTARARLTGDGSSFGGQPNYFLDYTVPASILFSFLEIKADSQIRVVIFTATDGNNINKDSLQNQGFQFKDAFSDPITFSTGNVRALLTLSNTLIGGPKSVVTGQVGLWTETVTITNTGKSTATTVFVSSSFGLNLITFLTSEKPSIGNVSVDLFRNTISWNVGNLTSGQSATLTFSVTGQFTSQTGGSAILNTAVATGFDAFTGGNLASAQAIITVNATDSGGVSGRIIDGATGLPISGASIELLDSANLVTAMATSDLGGGYGISSINPGTYTLSAAAANYSSASSPIVIASEQIVTSNLILKPVPSVIQGTITDTSGNPIAGAAIRIKDPYEAVVAEALSSASGFYLFPAITPGSYMETVSANLYQSQITAVTAVSGLTNTINFQLKGNPSTVTGTVRTGSNAVVPGATVEVISGVANIVATTTANNVGLYTINSIAPGTYGLRVGAPGFGTIIVAFTVLPGETISVNPSLVPNQGSVIGTVTDETSGIPLAGTSIRIVNSAGVTLVAALTDTNGQLFSSIPTARPVQY